MFAREHDSDTKAPESGRSTLDRFEQEMAKQYAALEDFARQSGELASARWQFCENRFDRGFDFDAIADCVKAQPAESESGNEEKP